MVVHVGANLLGFGGGRDVIAAVLAHEIGRNRGLNHVASGTNNLMSPGIDSFEFLQPYAASTQSPYGSRPSLTPAAATFFEPEAGTGERVISACGHAGGGVRTKVRE